MSMVSEPLPPAATVKYPKPPAVEVIFNVRTALPQPIDPRIFPEPVNLAFPGVFTEHKEMKLFESALTVKPDGELGHDLKTDFAGYQFIAPDKAFLAHYLMQGLSLNFLPPYSGYAACLAMFKEHWAVYQRVTGHAPAVAVTLRYIDRIDIPRDGNNMELDKYFTIAPPTLGLKAHNCYVQYSLNDEAQDVRARVIWSSLEDKPGFWSFALDTEATLDPANVATEEDIWLRFAKLHDWCTHVFEQSLTPTCKLLFQ